MKADWRDRALWNTVSLVLQLRDNYFVEDDNFTGDFRAYKKEVLSADDDAGDTNTSQRSGQKRNR